MITVLTLMSKVVFSPLWLLWHLYNGLWWAFQDDPTPRGGPAPSDGHRSMQASDEPAQARAFQVVDSAPAPVAMRRPVAALRGGFFGSVGIAISLGYLANVLVMNQWLDPARAASSWLLASAFTFVASLYAVRAAVRRESAARNARESRRRRARRAVMQSPAVAVKIAAAGVAAPPAFRRASVFARDHAARGASMCTAGLRQGVGALAAGLNRLNAGLAPKTASHAAPPSRAPRL